MNCPKCGANEKTKDGEIRPNVYECLSYVDAFTHKLAESEKCLRNQLATVIAERDSLLAEIGDFKSYQSWVDWKNERLQEFEKCKDF